MISANQYAVKAAMAIAELRISEEKSAKKDEQNCMIHAGNADRAIK